jgi:hypothetical protein
MFASSNYQYLANDVTVYGMPFRIDETNSTSGGGLSGTSNVFEASLWAVVSEFQAALAGLAGLNYNMNGYTAVASVYDAFDVTYTSGTPNTYSLGSSAIHPLYYGMLLFEEATPVVSSKNAELFPVAVAAGTSTNVYAFGSVDGGNNDRIVLVNADETYSGSVSLTAPSCTSASASYLTAAAYSTPNPIYINGNGSAANGQTFDGSTTGAITGTASPATLSPSSGVYSVPLATVQAVSVLFSPAGCLVSHT